MRWWIGVVLLGPATLPAQLSAPIGILRGQLLQWNYAGPAHSGQLTIRNSDNAVYTCLFDARTYFEREHRMIAPTGLTGGESVEVVADHKPESASCYARTVEVIDAPARGVAGSRPRLRTTSSPTETFAPRGAVAFGGLVVRLESGRFTVRTRAGVIHVMLRPDTRYLGGGMQLDAAALAVNAHVFIRAGYDFDGLLEAFQIVWGEIIAAQ
jgi:hypothetical protein